MPKRSHSPGASSDSALGHDHADDASPFKKTKTDKKWTTAHRSALLEGYFEMTMKSMTGRWDELAKKTGKTAKQCQEQFNPRRPGVRKDVTDYVAGKGDK